VELVDTHCHLPYLEHKPLVEVFSDARAVNVKKMVCIGASDGIKSAFDAVSLAEQHDFIWASVGVHPHSAGDYQSIDELRELATHERVVAIGETGLDYFKEWSPFEDQRKLFRNTVEFAVELGKPIIIHCRDARSETYETLKSLGAEKVGGVFHCYGETAEFAKQLRDMNFLVSLPGTLTFKKAEKLRNEVAQIPLEQIMLETDCPYMAPEPFRGKPSEPMHVYQIALRLAEIKGITLEEVAKITTENAYRLFGIA
jgi:TatD DNase family protein